MCRAAVNLYLSNKLSDSVDAKGSPSWSTQKRHRGLHYTLFGHLQPLWFLEKKQNKKKLSASEMQYDAVNTVYQIHECMEFLRFFL